MPIQETPVADSTTTTATDTATETPEPAASIADHAEQFSPTREPANTGQFAPKKDEERHRAQSQRATPEEVSEINKLTKELRETEQRVADKDPDAKSSPRLRTLRRQIAALKALDAPAPAPVAPKAEPKAAPTVTAGEFGEKEPDFDDFVADPAKYPDPLKTWTQATARYEARKDRWEEQQKLVAQSQQTDNQAKIDRWHSKQAEFAATKPDYVAKVSDFFQRKIGPILTHSLYTHDNGPAFVYYLAEHPELADELVLQTYGRPIDDAEELVAVVQRRLAKEVQQAQAVSTGSAAPPRPYTPPRPPNPVRTGPIKTDDEPPAEASSIAEHAKYHAPKR